MKVGIIGLGGHSRVIQDILLATQGFEIIAYFDDRYKEEFIQFGVFYGPIDSIYTFVSTEKDMKFVIAIGKNCIRKEIAKRLELSEEQYAIAIHPSAIISKSAKVGFGTVVMPYAVINANTIIGNHSIINTSSVVEHDNKIGDFAHISPNVTLTGGVEIEEGAHIGAGATVIPNKKVGKWSMVGAGATVIHNLPGSCTAVGTPAKVQINEMIGGGTA